MINLKQRTRTFQDCTAGYEIHLTKQYTVKEFIDEVLTKDEWGVISISDGTEAWYNSGTPLVEYKRGNLLNKMPDEYLDKVIIKATAFGGYSNMDYKLMVLNEE